MNLSLSVAASLAPRYDTLVLPDGAAGSVWLHRRYAGPFPYHRHRELEMNLVVSGEAGYLVSDNGSEAALRHPMRRGSMIWLLPTHDHLLLDPTPDFSMWIAVWRPETVAPYGTLSLWDRPIADLSTEAARWIERIFDDINDAAGSDDPDRRDVGIAYLLLAARSAHQRATAPATRAAGIHPAVARAARVLRDEVEPSTMNDLARCCGELSAARLARLFAEQMGVGIAAFRNRERLERFRRRRASSDLPGETLLESALASGFGSYAQFHRVYVAAYGHAPRETALPLR